VSGEPGEIGEAGEIEQLGVPGEAGEIERAGDGRDKIQKKEWPQKNTKRKNRI
jgi:hypothetical protein